MKNRVTEKQVKETREEINQRVMRLRCIPLSNRTPAVNAYLARHAGQPPDVQSPAPIMRPEVTTQTLTPNRQARCFELHARVVYCYKTPNTGRLIRWPGKITEKHKVLKIRRHKTKDGWVEIETDGGNIVERALRNNKIVMKGVVFTVPVDLTKEIFSSLSVDAGPLATKCSEMLYTYYNVDLDGAAGTVQDAAPQHLDFKQPADKPPPMQAPPPTIRTQGSFSAAASTLKCKNNCTNPRERHIYCRFIFCNYSLWVFVPPEQTSSKGDIPALVPYKIVVAISPPRSDKWFGEELLFGPAGHYRDHPQQSGIARRVGVMTESIGDGGGGDGKKIAFVQAQDRFTQ